jgi:hypothetical protein
MRSAIDAETRSAIESLVVEHAWLVDHKERSRIPDLYTEDCVVIGYGPPLTGREELRAWFAEREKGPVGVTLHIITNLHLERVSPHVIDGWASLLFYVAPSAAQGSVLPSSVSTYRDVYVNTDGGWRISRRTMERMFTSAPAQPA